MSLLIKTAPPGRFRNEIKLDLQTYAKPLISLFKPVFHYMAHAMTTTQKQSDYKVEQSSFTLIAMF